MIQVSVQFAPWDRPYKFLRMAGGREIKPDDFKVGDMLLVRTEAGTDLGKVVEVKEVSEKEKETKEEETLQFILRKANAQDLEKAAKNKKQKKLALEACEELIKKHSLPMKLIDVYFSYDGGRATFAYIAPERVDFRTLVKDLASHFHKSVRLYQVGVREEAGFAGDVGPCGRPLCCLKFLKDLGNISTELIFDQQLAHRGTERLSGVCGRLKCCLAFEEENYKELAKNLPAIGTKVMTRRGQGKVVDWHILKQSLDVEIGEGTVIEVPISEVRGTKDEVTK